MEKFSGNSSLRRMNTETFPSTFSVHLCVCGDEFHIVAPMRSDLMIGVVDSRQPLGK
jgi:hypothetical protein